MTAAAPLAELDRQVQALIDHGYPQVLGLDADRFQDALLPMQGVVAGLPFDPVGDAAFVVVVGTGALRAATAITLSELDGRTGFTTVDADDLDRFVPVDGVAPPHGFAYLIVDVDAGGDLVDVPPKDAMPVILERGRSPLTVHEGIALTTVRPDLLRAGSRYSLPGSRCGDQRVPAVWVSARRPRLGWCWDGAPHTWLGSASCSRRVGPRG